MPMSYGPRTALDELNHKYHDDVRKRYRVEHCVCVANNREGRRCRGPKRRELRYYEAEVYGLFDVLANASPETEPRLCADKLRELKEYVFCSWHRPTDLIEGWEDRAEILEREAAENEEIYSSVEEDVLPIEVPEENELHGEQSPPVEEDTLTEREEDEIVEQQNPVIEERGTITEQNNGNVEEDNHTVTTNDHNVEEANAGAENDDSLLQNEAQESFEPQGGIISENEVQSSGIESQPQHILHPVTGLLTPPASREVTPAAMHIPLHDEDGPRMPVHLPTPPPDEPEANEIPDTEQSESAPLLDAPEAQDSPEVEPDDTEPLSPRSETKSSPDEDSPDAEPDDTEPLSPRLEARSNPDEGSSTSPTPLPLPIQPLIRTLRRKPVPTSTRAASEKKFQPFSPTEVGSSSNARISIVETIEFDRVATEYESPTHVIVERTATQVSHQIKEQISVAVSPAQAAKSADGFHNPPRTLSKLISSETAADAEDIETQKQGGIKSRLRSYKSRVSILKKGVKDGSKTMLSGMQTGAKQVRSGVSQAFSRESSAVADAS